MLERVSINTALISLAKWKEMRGGAQGFCTVLHVHDLVAVCCQMAPLSKPPAAENVKGMNLNQKYI